MRNKIKWLEAFQQAREVKVGKVYTSLFVFGQEERKGEYFVKDHKDDSYLIQSGNYFFLLEGDVLESENCILAEYKTYGYLYNPNHKHYKIDPSFIKRIQA